MVDFGKASCLYDLNIPSDYVTCFNLASNFTIFDTSFMALIILFVGGWSLLRPVNEGLMVGGLLTSLIGVGLWALEAINMKTVMLPIFLMLAGIFITIIQRSSKD